MRCGGCSFLVFKLGSITYGFAPETRLLMLSNYCDYMVRRCLAWLARGSLLLALTGNGGREAGKQSNLLAEVEVEGAEGGQQVVARCTGEESLILKTTQGHQGSACLMSILANWCRKMWR